MILNMAGGGGAGGKIYVVGGVTQPSSPKENTIWVNTSVTITSWTMQYDQPSNPTQGMVWVMTAAYSNAALNPFSKMNAYFYPVSAKIYNSGSWVRCGGSVYTNGTWHPMRVYFYDNGDECTTITGGWTGNGTDINHTFTKYDTYMELEAIGPNLTYNSIYTINTIDIASFNLTTLHFRVKSSSASSSTVNVIPQNMNPYISNVDVGTYAYLTLNDAEQWIDLDVSNVTENVYMRLSGSKYYNFPISLYVYEIYGD